MCCRVQQYTIDILHINSYFYSTFYEVNSIKNFENTIYEHNIFNLNKC